MAVIRAALYVMGIGSWIWAAIAAFFTPWYPTLIILGALFLIAGGFVHAIAGGDGYDDTVFGSAEIIDLSERRAVWPNDAGAVE